MVLPLLAGLGAAGSAVAGFFNSPTAAGLGYLAAAMGLMPLINTGVKALFSKGADPEGLAQRVEVLKGHRDELAAGIQQKQGVDLATAQRQADEFIQGIINDEAPKYASQKPGADEWISGILSAVPDLWMASKIKALGAGGAAGHCRAISGR